MNHQFEQANLNEATLSRAMLRRAKMIQADLSEANLNEANLQETNLRRADFTEACLANASLVGVCLSEANLTRADFNQADLTRANLTDANLKNAQAKNANFNQSQLTGACLENFQINLQTSFEKVICRYLYLEHCRKNRVPRHQLQSLSLREFKSILQDLIGLIEVRFNQLIDWSLVVQAVTELQLKYGTQKIELRSIEAKSNFQFVVKLKVVPHVKTVEIKQYLQQQYNLLLLAKNQLGGTAIADAANLNCYKQN